VIAYCKAADQLTVFVRHAVHSRNLLHKAFPLPKIMATVAAILCRLISPWFLLLQLFCIGLIGLFQELFQKTEIAACNITRYRMARLIVYALNTVDFLRVDVSAFYWRVNYVIFKA
jgi:hypothetical protein